MHLSIIGILFLLLTSVPARAASPRQIKWQDLSVVTGKNVSLVMPGGAFISGKVLGVYADALRLNVVRTTDPGAYPKGEVSIPRASLRTLQVQGKGRKFRVIGVVIGAVAGIVSGFGAAVAIRGGILNNDHAGAAGLAFAGITTGGTVAGYVVGKRVDRRSTTYELVP